MSIPEDHDNLNPTGFDYSFATPDQWALMYRAAKLQVIPSYVPKEITGSWKRPLPSWADLQDRLAPDFTFERWYGTSGEHRARSNMGILTGRCSDNVFVIDLDIHKHPEAGQWWSGLLAIHNNNLPLETPTQQTGGGGLQMLFRAPMDWLAPTNRTSIGVDIRGQGGFAVMPPSRHESGKEYAWMPGMEPWHMAIAAAPDWLLDEVLELVEAHGGEKIKAERTPSPDADRNAFGSVQDGRESFMARCVYHAVLELYRLAPLRPDRPEEEAACLAGYEDYERQVACRIPDVPKRDGLDLEGRGPKLWMLKWRREMKKWGSPKMAEEAAKPNPHGDKSADFNPRDFEQPKVDPATGKPLPLVLTAKEFIDGYSPPAYVIDGIVQRGYLYSLTARTSHGKTAVAMYMAQCVARGEDMHGRRVKGGTVLMLAGENPDDIRARYLVLAESYGFDPAHLKMKFIAGIISVASRLGEIRAEVEKITDLMLVIVDTAAAYFPGDETNSNSQQGAYARLLRGLTFLNGKPAVIVNCHPIKNASRENLLPMGGSAFVNEVDGNLTLWANNERQAQLHWQGKFRGPEFDPIAFELAVAGSPLVKDSEGRLMQSVVAKPISEMTLEADETVQEADENKILLLIHKNPRAPFRVLAQKAGFMSDGNPQKYRVQRIVERLRDDRLVEKRRGGKYQLTRKGKKEIGVDKEKDDD